MLTRCAFDGTLMSLAPYEICPSCGACGMCKGSGPNVRQITLLDFLTPAQVEECVLLYPSHRAIHDKVIAPNMVEINRKLGQENDPNYLAYLVVFVLGAAK